MQTKKVTWIASEELDEMIQRAAADVMQSENDIPGAWKLQKHGDLHDDVLLRLQKDLNCVEIARSYRRARMEYIVHGKPVQK